MRKEFYQIVEKELCFLRNEKGDCFRIALVNLIWKDLLNRTPQIPFAVTVAP